MLGNTFFRNLILAVSIFGTCILAISAQSPKSGGNPDPSTNPRKFKKESADAFKRWITEDVAPIATADEIKAFNQLKTNEERENFITLFWQRRDLNSDTEENEYRDEYYERLAYANEHFTSGIPGWKTDRGRIYIRWGKPDSIDSHPSGGAYDQPSYEGGGSTTTYPFETWFYRHLDNVGDGIEIEFVDRTGSGEYRIARDANEKDALATVRGGSLNRNDGANSYMREQDLPFTHMQILKDLDTAPQVKNDLIGTLIGTPQIDNNSLAFDLRIDFFRQSDDRVITAFTIQTDNKDLKFESVGGLEQASMNILGRVTAVSGKRSGIFEDSVTTNSTASELASTKERKSVYQKAVALTPGFYKIDVAVRDVGTGNKGLVSMGFEVPKYKDGKLGSSSLILASKLRSTTGNNVGQPFVIGNAKVIPNLSGTFKRGQEVGLYMQVYNSGVDQTTLRPSVDVEYILTKDGKEIFRQPEDWTGLSDSGQRLVLARLLPTDKLPAGNYEIKVTVKDHTNSQLIENKSKFTIIQ
jgi:GWxTD domain-containing protein